MPIQMEQLREHAAKIAIGAVVLLGFVSCMLLWPSGTGAEQVLSNKVQFVCVETGEVFWFSRGETRTPPCENPRTGSATLLPAYTNANGELLVTNQGESLEKLGKRNKWVDPDSLRVRPPKS